MERYAFHINMKKYFSQNITDLPTLGTRLSFKFAFRRCPWPSLWLMLVGRNFRYANHLPAMYGYRFVQPLITIISGFDSLHILFTYIILNNNGILSILTLPQFCLWQQCLGPREHNHSAGITLRSNKKVPMTEVIQCVSISSIHFFVLIQPMSPKTDRYQSLSMLYSCLEMRAVDRTHFEVCIKIHSKIYNMPMWLQRRVPENWPPCMSCSDTDRVWKMSVAWIVIALHYVRCQYCCNSCKVPNLGIVTGA